MKQFIAIILTAVFFSAQYGKVSNYYHCVIINAVDKKPDCDCQKVLLEGSSAEKKIPLTPAHVHTISPDDFFVSPVQDTKVYYFTEIAGSKPIFTNNYSFTIYSPCFHPPEC